MFFGHWEKGAISQSNFRKKGRKSFACCTPDLNKKSGSMRE